MSLSTVALVGAFVAEVVLGEVPTALHPVGWFGRLVAHADREWTRPRLAGVILAAGLPVGAAVSAVLVVWSLGVLDFRLAVLAGAGVVFLSTSLRQLLATVAHVSRLAGEDLSAARDALPALVGRDASTLDAAEVRSAALESLAENLADGLVAPLTGFAVCALLAGAVGLGQTATLALAAGGAVWVKAVNTMDSMVGYPDTAHGSGAARLDDLVMWVPARETAGLLALWFGAPGALRRARSWTPTLASPNAGWPMGTLAAALDVRLEKPGYYVLHPDGRRPTHATVRRAIGRVGLAGLSVYAIVGVVTWY